MSREESGRVLSFENYYVWIIPSFSLLLQKKDSRIYSPDTFRSKLYLGCPSSSDRQYYRDDWNDGIPKDWLGLIVTSDDDETISINNVQFGFLSKNTHENLSYVGEWTEKSGQTTKKYFRIPQFIPRPYRHSFFVSGPPKSGQIICEFVNEEERRFINVSTQTEKQNEIHETIPVISDKEVEDIHARTSVENHESRHNDFRETRGTIPDISEAEIDDILYILAGTSIETLENRLRDFRHLEMFSQNFKELFTGNKHSDLIIKVKDREFKVHKTVLIARSSAFEAMFGHNSSEPVNDVISIEDCEPQVFEEFILFVYTGRTEYISFDNLYQLHYLSKKYNIRELKKECVHLLKKSLTIETICDILRLSEAYNVTEVHEHATKFLAKNLEEVLATDKWQMFLKDNADEANKLYLKAMKLGFTKRNVD